MEEKIKVTYKDTTFELATSPHLSTRLFYQWLSKSDPYAFYRSSASLVKRSESGRLLKLFIDLDIKKYYVFGEANRNAPAIKLLETVPKMRITRSGHFMICENPREFYTKLSMMVSGE